MGGGIVVEQVSVGAIATALLAKALNRAEDGLIAAGVQVARRALKALRRRFSRKGDGLLDELKAAEQIEGAEVQIADIKQEAIGASIVQLAAAEPSRGADPSTVSDAAGSAAVCGPLSDALGPSGSDPRVRRSARAEIPHAHFAGRKRLTGH